MAFSGTFDYSLDAKNRLTVPAKFRSSLSDKVVLARGTERCLTLWPQRDFELFVAGQLEPISAIDPRRDVVKRFWFSGSFETELDSAGRVGIPPRLMDHAQLDKEVVVNGVDDRIEVWDRSTWSAYSDDLDITALMAEIAATPPPGAPAA